MDILLGNKRVRVSARMAIGKGGEADVYDLGPTYGRARALKLFKNDKHPDVAGQPAEESAARARLLLHQTKLPAFPRGLPSSIIAPDDLARDKRGVIVGYSMPLVGNSEPLLRYGEPNFRRAGATSSQVARIFRTMHESLSGLHAKQVLIGDFNDLNVLVQSAPGAAVPHFIDADSFQFDRFPCLAFTERFLDPRLAGKNAVQMMPALPFDESSDWFAYAALFVQSLLLVGPWGGMHRPSDPAKLVPPKRRALDRVSIFRDQVQLPKAALPRESLPDELLHELSLTFEKDERRPLPRPILDRLAFQICPSCSLEHARGACPICRPHAAAPTRQIIATRGSVTAKTIFETRGTIVAAAMDAKGLRIVHHNGNAYLREDNSLVLSGPRAPSLRFYILGDQTLVALHGQLALSSASGGPTQLQADLCEGTPTIATHDSRLVWSSAGQLFSADANSLAPPNQLRGLQLPPIQLGEVLSQGTRLWTGPSFGLGLTRAGEVTRAFRFAPARRGIDDSLIIHGLSDIKGRILSTRAAFTPDRAWLVFALQEGLKTIHRCLLIDAAGALLAMAEAEAGDGSWLGAFPEICAAGDLLFAASDDGLVRLEQRNHRICEVRRFPDTAPFLDAETRLFAAPEGILAVGERRALALRIQ